jgi:hypothetical protein
MHDVIHDLLKNAKRLLSNLDPNKTILPKDHIKNFMQATKFLMLDMKTCYVAYFLT